MRSVIYKLRSKCYLWKYGIPEQVFNNYFCVLLLLLTLLLLASSSCNVAAGTSEAFTQL
jgi:hypothetical protein